MQIVLVLIAQLWERAPIRTAFGVGEKMPSLPQNRVVKNHVFADMWHGIAQVNSSLKQLRPCFSKDSGREPA